MKYIALLAFLCASPVLAQDAPLPWLQTQPAAKQPVDQDVIAAAEAYFNGVKTLQAGFTQTTPQGDIVTGTLYLQRPGKMRWEYAPPVPVVMISRGTILRYYDYELEQVSDMPIKGTLAEFLGKERIAFNDPAIHILDAYESDGLRFIRITQKDAPEDGELSFVFSAPDALKTILIKGANDEHTHIAMEEAALNVTLDEELFKFIGSYRKKGRR